MAILVITVVVAIMAIWYVRTNKNVKTNIDKIKVEAMQALDKIEPAIAEVEEVVEKAKKISPKNAILEKASQEVGTVKEAVKKVKESKK
jgi:uncharacterized protein YoxC